MSALFYVGLYDRECLLCDPTITVVLLEYLLEYSMLL